MHRKSMNLRPSNRLPFLEKMSLRGLSIVEFGEEDLDRTFCGGVRETLDRQSWIIRFPGKLLTGLDALKADAIQTVTDITDLKTKLSPQRLCLGRIENGP